jgi:type I restriction enzyme R subunit
MASHIAESHVEAAAIEWLERLGYIVKNASEIAPDTHMPERFTYGDVVLADRLKQAITRLNPSLPSEAHADAVRRVLQSENPLLIEENRRLHKAMVEGVDVEFYGEDGVIRGEQVRLIDFDDVEANDWLVLNQFTVIENKAMRRPDIVIFINGLPVVVIELKNPGQESATLKGAFNQLQTYKGQISSLFRTNAMLVISDGLTARIGSLTADWERFMPWRTVDGDELEHKGAPELETLLSGVFERRRVLALLKDFIVFGDTGSDTVKILAGYHQFHAVRHAVDCTLKATGPEGDRRVGVVWHTQGSGKSLLMAFYAGQIIKHPAMENPTLVIITDRNDLDDQLFGTFSMCKDLLRQTPQQANSHEELFKLLDRPAGGVIFTTIQKFAPQDGDTDGPLTQRRNVVVVADEAHRSQYGLKAKVGTKTGEISYGFAKYLRDALPAASFIGFTGTPIEKDDVNTPAVFGDYIDVYDISRAVADGATVAIYYESRLARIELPDEEKAKIDEEIAELTEEDTVEEQEHVSRRWSGLEAIVGSEKRLALVAEDLVRHFEARLEALDGKGMIVCMSRSIAVALYKEITKLRPGWHTDDDETGNLKVVMTGSASDPGDWQQHIGKRPKMRRDLLAKRAKDSSDCLKLVIVCDMWLTGFDAPCMHTMYIDKPMKGHGLMQAIARVNRVFRDKPAGLVVDYIGIAQNLKEALSQYSGADRGKTGIDESAAVALMLERYDIVREMFRPDRAGGFNYRTALVREATSQQRLAVMAGAIEWVLTMQQQHAARETTDEAKKRVHRRYSDAVLELSKAFALASASDAARDIREEVGFFQAVRTAMVKSATYNGRSPADRELAIQQIISRAVVSTEIIDIMKAAGVASPDISILSDEFLTEVRGMEKKNLALEALRKLINGEVHSQSKRNIVQARAFSERLDEAIARYHSNAITTVQVLEELLQLAQDIRVARERGGETGLTPEEIAFYDALAENKSAREVMGEPALRVIAQELLTSIKGNISIDWMYRDAARAHMRVLVKRILRKYGYPPDLQDAAVLTVLQQAEALSAEWAASIET